jgi:hypothetical protein
MKQGKSLIELAQALEDIKTNAKDFLVPTARLKMTEDNQIEFANGKTSTLSPNAYSHGQIATYSGVPKAYYDKLMSENPKLLTKNVNHGFEKQASTIGKNGKPETRLIRAYGDNVRALLSSSYRRLDSYDCCQAVLPVLHDGKFEVVSSDITETRMYLKALTPKLTAEIKKGDMVQYGLVISNSDVGAGSLRVEPLIYRLICTNGMISNTAIKKFHVGRNMAAGDDVLELLSDKTMALTDKAFWAQIQDIVLASMKPELFEFEVNRLREAADQRIKNADIPEVVELTMKAVNVDGEGTKNNIIQYLANGADGAGLTKWGLVNGITYAAQDEKIGYDKSIELERAASKILELNPNQWRRIAEVA